MEKYDLFHNITEYWFEFDPDLLDRSDTGSNRPLSYKKKPIRIIHVSALPFCGVVGWWQVLLRPQKQVLTVLQRVPNIVSNVI